MAIADIASGETSETASHFLLKIFNTLDKWEKKAAAKCKDVLYWKTITFLY